MPEIFVGFLALACLALLLVGVWHPWAMIEFVVHVVFEVFFEVVVEVLAAFLG